ncbi:Prefoldin subunit 4, partial [Caulochytrium protostelioides]
LEDLAQEWELADEDDGPFKYRIGDTFVDLTLEESQERLAAATAAVQKELQAMKAQMDEAHAEVARLKKILYGKFGKSINLEM